MNIGVKIRSLLLVLGICCIVTTSSIHHSLTPESLLESESAILQKNLSLKELKVKQFLADRKKIEEAKKYHKNHPLGLQFIDNYRDIGINILTFEGNALKFWSTIKAFPRPSAVREGTTFIEVSNGYYTCVKKTEGSFTIIFLISVKNQYSIENRYLKNEILADLSPRGVLDLSYFTDKPEIAHNINKLDGKFLFAVRLRPNIVDNTHSQAEVWLWFGGIFFICMFFNSLASWLARDRKLLAGTLILVLFFIALRISDLQYGWLNHRFNLVIFDPKIFAQSFLLPSLGDLLLNCIAVTWVILFIYTNRKKYRLPGWLERSRIAGIVFQVFLLVILSLLAYLTDEIFFGLIYNSKIGFDINIINLDWVSWICVMMLCLSWFNIYLFAIVFVKLTIRLNLSNREKLYTFLTAFSAYFIYRAFTSFTVFFIIYSLLLLLLAYNIIMQKRRFSLRVFSISLLCMALITSIKFIRFTDIKERTFRMNIAKKLETADDPKVINAIDILERGITRDAVVRDYFLAPSEGRQDILQNHILKKYLEGFLSQFEINMYTYDQADSALHYTENQPIKHFREMVMTGALKTLDSSHFYRINDTFGYQNYFGIIPVFNGPAIVGTFVIELKSRPYNYTLRFPDLLVDGKIKTESDYNNYSFAFYNNNVLINQSGKFTYNLLNRQYQSPVGRIKFLTTALPEYSHLIYAPTSTKIIVISKERITFVTRLAALSFFFLIFILFSFVVYLLIWFLKNLENNSFGWFSLNKYLAINANKILYRTRIQVSIILAVVVTLLAVGWTTFFNISYEYRRQQSDQIRDKIRKVQLSYEKSISKTGIVVNEQAAVQFNQFADINAAFLNLYNTRGELLFTSVPKMYDSGLMGRKMGAKAYINLHGLNRSEFINANEKIGDFQYAAAYVPVRNSRNETIAYLGSPFFNNEEDYGNKIGLFVNTLINIYALVFVAIGILAIFLANQITNPLTFIQESIRQTKLGKRNQPIQWARQDEIGSLISEYNKMIAALEVSAVRLARSEREHAWREMAKQVAHEIKNPLTPLKLGVQLLERSWKENDPNFETKFENFNRSFIEQIDSLARIASEFSNFARMPDTKLENVLLLPVIEQAKDVFTNSGEAEIFISNKTGKDPLVLGDKDQLLRTFNNLFKNAIEATPEGKSTAIKIIVYYSHDQVIVAVEDNGRGIEKDQHEKIFAPNFTTKSSGTGLGLAFVKQAIENAGGKVSFQSEPGAGTTFILSFPLV